MSSTDHLPELDSLRAQVAALSHELAERERASDGRCQRSDESLHNFLSRRAILRAILEGAAADTGDEFFASLANQLTSNLKIRYALIGEIIGGETKRIRTLAFSVDGMLVDNFEFEWEQTGCNHATERAIRCVERGAQVEFPHLARWATLGVESYCVTPLCAKTGPAIGLLALMDIRPLVDCESLASLMGGVASRAAAELQRRQAEEVLKERHRRLVKAQAQAHLGSWDWHIAGGEMSWSDELFRILGHEPQSMPVTCETLFTALLPDDHDRVLTALNEALTAKASSYDVECRIVRPSGEIRFLHCRGEVMRDEAGYPAAVSGICLDITDRKRMEEALRSGEERWQLALQASLNGIRDWNMRTSEVFYSPRWKALLGYADHDLTDSLDEWRSRIHPDDLERVLQRLDAYVGRHCPEFSEEYRIQRKDGSYLWILDRAAALWDEQGRPCRLIGSVAAIPDPKPTGDAPAQDQE